MLRARRSSELRVVGIDDWSWRRATSYGTIIVDLERRSVVDILEDRDVVTAARWLRDHPSVGIVSRDRCGCMRRPPVKARRKPNRSPIGFTWSRTFVRR